jgi:glycosyltransferase involved in cell wall biosynthesis
MKSPARLMVIIGSLNRGGAETHLLNVLPRLDRTRLSPEVFVLSERGELADEMESRGVSVSAPWMRIEGAHNPFLTRMLRLAAVAVQLWWRLMTRRPRIVHFFLPESYIIGAPVSLLAGIRCRVMSRRSLNLYQNKRPMLHRIEKMLHRTLSSALGNSKAIVRELVDEGIPPPRVRLIYNGVDLIPYDVPDGHSSPLRAAFGLPPDGVMLVMVANLIPYKGHEDLIRALACVSGKMLRPWRLVCLGRDDGIGPRLQSLAVELGVAGSITFAGARADVAAVLQASDIGILASHEEGFSNAILEYMAARLPVVATAVGGNREAICDGETGYLVPPRDPEALGKAIATLANDPELSRKIGRLGRKKVEEQFSLNACVAEYEGLYFGLCQDN